jgi:6-phosphogluconolactonase
MAWKEKIRGFDESRDIAIIGTHENTLDFCVEHFIEISNEAIADHDYFAVALAGGSTPKAIYQKLAEHSSRINWKKVLLFWSDERSVPPTDPESNYRMAMIAGFERIPIPSENIFRMKGEGDIEKHAKE